MEVRVLRQSEVVVLGLAHGFVRESWDHANKTSRNLWSQSLAESQVLKTGARWDECAASLLGSLICQSHPGSSGTKFGNLLDGVVAVLTIATISFILPG
jgi:hypothetical protein